jgi:hypothetical protein
MSADGLIELAADAPRVSRKLVLFGELDRANLWWVASAA